MSNAALLYSDKQDQIKQNIEETNRKEIDYWISQLTLPVEMRLLGTNKKTVSGYFDDAKKLGDAVEYFSGLNDQKFGQISSVYVTLNPVNPDLLARAYNRVIDWSKVTTSGKDITRRLWLPLDCDSVKPTGIMATDAEYATAVTAMQGIADYLEDIGFPKGLRAKSGNGGHAMYRIDLPNDEVSTLLIKQFLEALKLKFPEAHLDTTVFDPNRIWKVYGTIVAKGDEVGERRYRAARILSHPDMFEIVDPQLIHRVIETRPIEAVKPVTKQASGNEPGESFDLYAFLKKHQVEIRNKTKDANGNEKFILEHCPFNPEHLAPDAAVFRKSSGKLGFKCLHNSCANNHWNEFRTLFEPKIDRKIKQNLPEASDLESIITVPTNLPDSNTERVEKKKLTMLDRSDLGNAILFCDLHGLDLRYVREWKKWISWNGTYWKTVSTENIIAKYAQPMVRNHLIELTKTIKNDDERKRWLSHVSASNSSHKIRAMLDMVGPRLMVEVGDLNPDPNLFCTQNAVIDLTTCSPVEPKREQLITVATPAKYDPDAKCPTFIKFIESILVDDNGTPCKEMVDYVQRSFGYCLTPSIAEQIFFILHGTGKNGKSTLLDAVMNTLGEYAIQGSDTLYFDAGKHGSSSNNEDEARLYGKRLCVTSETKASTYFSAAKVKRLTGGDRITASYKYASQFQFDPTHKLFLLCNHKPKFDPSDDAMVRRIKLIPFNFVVPADQRDKLLAKKLKSESSGILNWMIDGLFKLNNGIGLDDENTPEIMRAVKEQYLMEVDELQDFIDSYLVADINGTITKDDLYRKYKGWCGSVGKLIMSKRTLGIHLTARKWKETKIANERVWSGYVIKPVVDLAYSII